MKDFQQPMKLKEALGLFYDKFDGLGKALPILIDTAAFKEEDPNADDIRETDLQFPDYPRKMPFVAALRLALYQVQSKAGATFLIRPGMYVEITTLKRASAENLVKQKVLIDFRKRPVAEVLEELADLTSTTVILDERVGKKADTPITAIFRNEITLADALTLVTDMADLKVVYLDSAVYVTTPENARRIQQEMRESREKPRKVTDPVRKRGS
jgi:type II secretory pathway component GspD/PulD (secretin)